MHQSTNFQDILSILTHVLSYILAYIAKGKKSSSILQQFTKGNARHYLVPFYDVILPVNHVSLMLDGVMSFLHVITIKNTHKCLCYSQTFGGFLQYNGRKLEESEGYNCFFIVSCVLESK